MLALALVLGAAAPACSGAPGDPPDPGADASATADGDDPNADAGRDGGPSDPEPGDTGPDDTDPGDAAPGDTGPADTEPRDADPDDTDPDDTDPDDTDPDDTDPADTDPADTDPDDTDQGDTGATDARATDTDATDTELRDATDVDTPDVDAPDVDADTEDGETGVADADADAGGTDADAALTDADADAAADAGDGRSDLGVDTESDAPCLRGEERVGGVCVPIDDCVSNTCDPNARCQDRVEAYSCHCAPGWAGDGRRCEPSGCPVAEPVVFERGVTGDSDCITDRVCLARGDGGPLYNTMRESSPLAAGCDTVSPLGVRWAAGPCAGNTADFGTLHRANDCGRLADLPGKTMCMYLLSDALWFDVQWTSFMGGSTEGGFGYVRTLVGGSPCPPNALCLEGGGCACPEGTVERDRAGCVPIDG